MISKFDKTDSATKIERNIDDVTCIRMTGWPDPTILIKVYQFTELKKKKVDEKFIRVLIPNNLLFSKITK